MYIIVLIDEGSLRASAFTPSKEKMIQVVESWYNEHSSSSNDEGYIAVEIAAGEGEMAERVLQINLDEDPLEARIYLEDKYSELS